MIRKVDLGTAETLDDYASVVHFAPSVSSLRAEARTLASRLRHRKVWMVSSTARGGGVAEMLPKLVALLRELGVPTEWVVIGTERREFFGLTKRIHNLIHGHGDRRLTSEDRALYEEVSRENAAELRGLLGPDDILVLHDPQPLGTGRILASERGVPAVFRCHIGLDDDTWQTQEAWEFLQPYAEACTHSIFSTAEYIPAFLRKRASVIRPAIDPLSPKNKELTAHQIAGILASSGLDEAAHPVVTPRFPEQARRLEADGTFGEIAETGSIGLPFRPAVVQISRWDRLKGFKPLIDAFVRLKEMALSQEEPLDAHHRYRLEIVRLLLVGPEPAAIQDDPEAREALAELIDTYRGLEPRHQKDIALISLPMGSLEDNALMVNALQRASALIVQNSISEGFGLTVTEAMWKRMAVLGTRACGIRKQIRDGIDGRLTHDPEDPEELAHLLNEMLENWVERSQFGLNAQRRVHDEFLIFGQVRRWLQVLAEVADPANSRRP